MKYVEKVFEQATIKGIADYLLYQEKPHVEDKGYEIRMDEAFKEFEEVALTYDADRESKLIDAVDALASELTDVYTEIGLQAGFLIMLDMMKKGDYIRSREVQEISDGVYRKMYDSIFLDVSKGLKLLHDKGSEAMKAVESILIESQHKTKEIYMNFEK